MFYSETRTPNWEKSYQNFKTWDKKSSKHLFGEARGNKDEEEHYSDSVDDPDKFESACKWYDY